VDGPSYVTADLAKTLSFNWSLASR
jgi:hypothetical protein